MGLKLSESVPDKSKLDRYAKKECGMDYRISVAIRTYNEEKHIRDVLDSLKRQTYKNYEIIILDSESTDNTVKIAAEYDTRIERISKGEFNYSYASNKLVEYAAGEIVCFLSGHSVPVKDTYLEELNEIFRDQAVGGCYGDVIALPDGSFTEKAFHWLGYVKNKILDRSDGIQLETTIHPGIFSCSNAAARTHLLRKHPFAQELGKGGEDIEVAYRIMKDGYYIAKVPDLLVMHSHGKGFFPFLKEYLGWKVMWKAVLAYIKKQESIEVGSV